MCKKWLIILFKDSVVGDSTFICIFAAVMNDYGTILVIDDNEAILTALKYCLAGTFSRIFTLTSPDSVLSLLKQER